MRKDFLTAMVAAILALCLSSTGIAEDNKFKIHDYIPEYFKDFKWRVDGAASLSGQKRDTYYNSYLASSPRIINEDDNQTAYEVSLGTDANYTYETVRYLLNAGIVTNLGISGSEDKSSREYSKSYNHLDENEYALRVYSASFQPTVDAAAYLWRDLMVSVQYRANANYHEKPLNRMEYSNREWGIVDSYVLDRKSTTIREYHSKERWYDIGLNIAVGWGRTYDGRFASTAMYLIEELRASNLLLREATRDEMIRLSEIVYVNRLEHAVDSRIRRQEALDDIISFLTEAGVMIETGHLGYLAIEDVWDFFPRTERRFGWKIGVGYQYDYEFCKNEETLDQTRYYSLVRYHVDSIDIANIVFDTSISYNYCLRGEDAMCENIGAFMELYRPLSRRWQLDAAITAYYITDSRYSESREGSCHYCSYPVSYFGRDNHFRFALYTDATYIFDSRTNLKFGSDIAYRNYRGFDWTLGINADLEYRLSLPTTLVLSGAYTHSKVSPDYGRIGAEDGYSISVSLSHYLY